MKDPEMQFCGYEPTHGCPGYYVFEVTAPELVRIAAQSMQDGDLMLMTRARHLAEEFAKESGDRFEFADRRVVIRIPVALIDGVLR